MRRGEILNMHWRDVSFEKRTLRIPITKNGHARTIPLSSCALALLRTLSDARTLGTERILPITENAAKMAWKRLAKRARLEDLRFHDLRHEAISRFFEKGLNVPEVALISGHRDPRMLFRYTHPAPRMSPRSFDPGERRTCLVAPAVRYLFCEPNSRHVVEGGTQAFGQFESVVVCPEMHEEQARLLVEHVAVQSRDLNAVRA
jgi:Phage integrase family